MRKSLSQANIHTQVAMVFSIMCHIQPIKMATMRQLILRVKNRLAYIRLVYQLPMQLSQAPQLLLVVQHHITELDIKSS